jgi:hypothetical protein
VFPKTYPLISPPTLYRTGKKMENKKQIENYPIGNIHNENTEEYYKSKYSKEVKLYYISNKIYEGQIVEDSTTYKTFEDNVFFWVRNFPEKVIALKITHKLRWKKRIAVLDHYRALDNNVGLNLKKISEDLQSTHRFFENA